MSKPAIYLTVFASALLNVSVGTPALADVPQPAPCLAHAASADSGTPSDVVPADRLATLSRGVNVTDLFGDNNEPLVPLFMRLRRAGIRHVRIPISPDVFAPNPPSWQGQVLARLDQAVCSAIAARVGIVIDLHPTTAAELGGGTNRQIVDRLSAVWQKLAARYAHVSPDLIFFEVFNEPKFPDGQEWERLQASIVTTIRSVAPLNTLILTASPWSKPTSLSAMTPIADRNVVYTFHTYTPMIFTHQGASWSLPSYASIGGLTFPANTQNVLRVAGHAGAERQNELAAYGRDFEDDQRIANEIDAVASWSHRYGVPVIVTEFGVFNAAPSPARAAWLSAVRRDLEARGIGWTVWEYRGGFGIAPDLQRGCSALDSAAKALNLCGQ